MRLINERDSRVCREKYGWRQRDGRGRALTELLDAGNAKAASATDAPRFKQRTKGFAEV